MSNHYVCPCPDGCNGCEVPDFAVKEIERLGAALNAVYHHAPINPEYGYQGVDADAMFFIAKKAIANSGVEK